MPNILDCYVWSGVEPAQPDINWFIGREFGGKWYYLIPNHECIVALNGIPDMPSEVPYLGTNQLEI